MDLNQHYAMLLGLGEKWTVSDVTLSMGARRGTSFRGKEADDFACLMTALDNHRILEVACGRSEDGARALIEKSHNPVQQYVVCEVAMDMTAPFQKAVRNLFCLSATRGRVDYDIIYT